MATIAIPQKALSAGANVWTLTPGAGLNGFAAAIGCGAAPGPVDFRVDYSADAGATWRLLCQTEGWIPWTDRLGHPVTDAMLGASLGADGEPPTKRLTTAQSRVRLTITTGAGFTTAAGSLGDLLVVFAHSRTGSASNTSGATVTVAFSGAVGLGDFVYIAVSHGSRSNSSVFSSSGNLADNKDTLGNQYTQQKTVADTTDGQWMEVYGCIVTAAGTPSVRVQWNPTPGTTNDGAVFVTIDTWTGSDAASVMSAAAGQLQTTPGTGANSISSGAYTSTVNGSLLVGTTMLSNIATPTTDFTAGTTSATFTKYTVAQVSAHDAQANEGGVQTTAGSGTLSTFGNSKTGTTKYMTAGFAVSPAAVGVNHSIVGAVTVTVTASSPIAHVHKHALVGAAPVAVTPASPIAHVHHHALVGVVPVVVTPAAPLVYGRHHGVVGAVPMVVTPASALAHIKRPAKVGAVPVAVTPAATLAHVKRPALAGAVTVTATIAGLPDFTARDAIVGTVSVVLTPGSALLFTRAPTPRAIAGAVTVAVSPAAVLRFGHHPAKIGAVPVVATASATLAFAHHHALVGAVLAAVVPQGSPRFTRHASILGAVPVTVSLTSALAFVSFLNARAGLRPFRLSITDPAFALALSSPDAALAITSPDAALAIAAPGGALAVTSPGAALTFSGV